MARKSRIGRAVKSGGTARRDNHRTRLDGVKSIVLNSETERPVNPVVVNGKIENVHVVQHLNVRRLRDCRSQNRLNVFAVDLDVAISSRHIFAIFIFQDDKPQLFQMRGDFVELLGDGIEQILADDSVGILLGIFHVVPERAAFGNVGVQGVYASGKTTAPLDVRLFYDEYLEAGAFIFRGILYPVGITCGSNSGITAGRPAAYNQQIRFKPFYLHSISVQLLVLPNIERDFHPVQYYIFMVFYRILL